MTSSTRVGAPPRAPDQTIIYAVGDVHGRLDLLERLTEQLAVETEAAAGQGKRTIAIFLGDYIDKGPDAAGVVEHLIRFREQAECETIFLRGNHEDVLLSLVDGHEDSARWLEYGGVETLRSYGVSFRGTSANPSPEKLRQTTIDAVPAQHVAFLRETELNIRFGDYIFVHAGLRPDRLIEEQTDSDMMWFRYYDDEPPIWSGMAVHGHSVNARPIRGRAHIGIDTGAYATDALTALRLEDDRQDFLKVWMSPEDGEVEIDFWDTVDRAFAGGVRPVAASPRGRGPSPAKTSTKARPAAKSRPARKAKPPPKTRTKTTAKRAPAAGSGKARPFPAMGAAAIAAAIALGAASVVAVVLYGPQTDNEPNDVSPQSIAAELKADETSTPAANSQETAEAGDQAPPAEAPPSSDAPAATADLRSLNPAMAADRNRPPVDGPSQVAVKPVEVKPASPPRAPPAGAATSAPARVQIAAAASVADAQREWTGISKQFPSFMNGKGFQTEQVQVGDRTLYRTLVAGFASGDEARRFCDRLRQAGRDCIIRPDG